MERNNNPYFNGSGYPDPTAFHGTKDMMKEEADLDKKVHNLINVLKYIVNLAGFEFVGRVHLRHKKTRKEFK